MKMRKIILLIVLLLAIIGSFCLMYTNSKYTSTVSGNASTSVAQYHFNVTGSDSYNSQDTISNLKLAQTCNPETLIEGKIAPGTEGSFEIVVDTSDSEVGIGYKITFNNSTNNAIPQNLILKLDGENWNFEDGIDGVIYANSSSQQATHTINWKWAYETENGDEADTQDGKNAFDYSFDIVAVGTQLSPITE